LDTGSFFNIYGNIQYTNAVMVELFDITTTNFRDDNNHRVIWESNNTGNVIVIRDCTKQD
jgi:hypothetical protein